MNKLRSYISLFFLALLLVPCIEKARHEFNHLDSEECRITEKHFCSTEHTCDACDYVFSSSAAPLDLPGLKSLFSIAKITFSFPHCLIADTAVKYRISPRGPPASV
jgi:hypothetical protein